MPKTIDGETITVLVGYQRKSFLVHRNLICHYSPFFRTACDRPWEESEGIILLREVPSGIFDIYFKWLYSDKLVLDGSDRGEMMRRAINAYVLGEQLLDFCFRNALMDTLLSMQDCALLVGGSNVDVIYKCTTELSPMRKFAVDWFMWLHHSRDYHPASATWRPNYLPLPLEFLHDVVDAFIERSQPDNFSKRVQAPWDKDPCDYHPHQDGQECNPNNTAELR